VLGDTLEHTHKLERKLIWKTAEIEVRVSGFGAPDCPVCTGLSGVPSARWGQDGPRKGFPVQKPESARFTSWSIVAHRTAHRTVRCAPDSDCSLSSVPSAQRLAVRTSRWSRPLAHWWRTGLSSVPMHRRLLVTASWWVRAIYTPLHPPYSLSCCPHLLLHFGRALQAPKA
jgi:hypothetical protein